MAKTKDRDGIIIRDGYYRISYTDAQGRRRREKTSASTLTQARALRSAKMGEAERARVLGYAEPSKDTFAAFVPRYLEYQQARLTPKAYQRSRGIVETHLTAAFGTMRLAELRRIHVQGYITERSGKVTPGSVIKELNVLKHILAVAVQWELIPVNHARGAKPPKTPAGRLRYLQPTEAPGLLAACPAWLRPMVLLALASGMRRGELLGVRWLDVDRAGSRILLPQTKNGDGRAVWLNATACRVIDSLPRSTAARDCIFLAADYASEENVSLAFLRACRKAGIHDFTFHDLRHTCGSWMGMQGAGLHTIAAQLGHRDIRMAARYTHLSPTYSLDAVRGLDRVFVPELADGFGAATGPDGAVNLPKLALTVPNATSLQVIGMKAV